MRPSAVAQTSQQILPLLFQRASLRWALNPGRRELRSLALG